jgi:hypothetical protein
MTEIPYWIRSPTARKALVLTLSAFAIDAILLAVASLALGFDYFALPVRVAGDAGLIFLCGVRILELICLTNDLLARHGNSIASRLGLRFEPIAWRSGTEGLGPPIEPRVMLLFGYPLFLFGLYAMFVLEVIRGGG